MSPRAFQEKRRRREKKQRQAPLPKCHSRPDFAAPRPLLCFPSPRPRVSGSAAWKRVARVRRDFLPLPLRAELTIHRGSPRSARPAPSHTAPRPVSHGARGRRCPVLATVRVGEWLETSRELSRLWRHALVCLGKRGGERKKKTRFPSSLSRENPQIARGVRT